MNSIQHRDGAIDRELIAIIVIVVIVVSAVAYKFLRKNILVYTDPYGITIDYGTLREEAELVIVGRIARMYDKSHRWAHGEQHWYSIGYYDIAVEAVERGTYDNDTITVVMGCGSDTSTVKLWLPYLKKQYSTNERVRIYVNYDKEMGYYTPALWFTIEPAP